MNIHFDSWDGPEGLGLTMLRAVISSATDQLLEGVDTSDYHLHVVTLDDHVLPSDGESQVYGATYVHGDKYNTAEVEHFHLGIWHGLAQDPGLAVVTVCHEMIHLAQYITGRLRVEVDDDDIQTFWIDEEIDDENTDYDDLPWEVEAYELQDTVAFTALASEGFLKVRQLIAHM